MTPDLIAQILGVRAEVTPDPVTGTPMVIPIGRHGARLTQARVSR
jgi:iron complex transport system ATP-binding protein